MLVRRGLIFTICLLSLNAFAVEVAPATTGDMDNFESTIEREQVSQEAVAEAPATPETTTKKKADKKKNFGQIVSAKAKEQRNLPAGEKRGMGTFVSGERSQSAADSHTSSGASAAHRQNAADKSQKADAGKANGNGNKK